LADENESRVCAFTKRLLQACWLAPTHFVCGVQYLLQTVSKAKPCIRQTLLRTSKLDTKTKPETKAKKGRGKRTKGKAHGEESEGEGSGAKEKNAGEGDDYNAFDRNPGHCNAQESWLWESGKQS
jgi:hypothetical protein